MNTPGPLLPHLALTLIAALLATAPGAALGQLGQEAAPPRVVVVELDAGARDQQLGDEVAGNLADLGLDVLAGESLEAALQAQHVAPPPPELASRFSPMSSIIASGVERFFYKGNEAAIDTLSPVFDLGMTHREVLARRPDYADQIYQAGIVLLRAYANTDQPESATAVAQLLVKNFPSKRPSATTVPPKTIAVLEEHSRALQEGATALTFAPLAAEGCTGYINGGAAKATTYPVAPGTPYFVTVDCGTDRAPVWRVEVPRGETLAVPVPSGDLKDFSMTGGDFKSRRLVEGHLRAVAFWTQASTIVGVSRDAAPEGAGLLVVRLDRGANAQWSDGATQRSVTMALQRVFPEYADDVADEPGLRASEAGPAPWLGWGLVGAGVALGGTGGYLLYSAEDRARVLDCSGHDSMPAELSGRDCADVRTEPFTAGEFEANASAITTRRVLGWTSVGIGVGALAYGIYRLIESSEGPEPGPAVTLSPWFDTTQRPIGASLSWRH